jgi:hypothetical protein
VGKIALQIGSLDGAWREELRNAIVTHPFVTRGKATK